ncbi:MAG: hypothetical protein A2505_08265 [Deltaproteobacteria bacterium RIFOXYD12_FULL_55_16]|nr:MAG: hypothetical protein A2505_08265 [Deltaproteobacteria bacterium RIFOXYD12_FULL_55_16]
MSRDHCDNSSTAVLAFLAGTVVGAAIALLTAPKTGQETREMLADYGAELKERAKTLPDDFKEYKETALERSENMIALGKELISKGTDLAAQGKEFLDEKKRTLSEAIEAGKIAMQEEREALAHKLEGDD